MDFYRRSSVHPRASVFPSASSAAGQKPNEGLRLYLPHLEACIKATTQSSDTLRATLEDLHDGTGDLPRLTKVLENSRLFLLVNENLLRSYKSQLADEIEPQVSELITKAEKSLGVLERREALLKKKLDTHESRQSTRPVGPAAATKAEERRLKLMATRRDRILKELDALEDDVKTLQEGRLNGG